MAAVTICSDFGAQRNKVWHCFHCFPIYFPWSDGTRWHDLSFLRLSFKPTFSLSSFTFIKRLFSSSSLSAVRVVSSAYLGILIFLLEILIPACASSSPGRLLGSNLKENESEVAQSCPTLSDPMNCSPLGSSVHWIFQARVLGWGAITFPLDKFSRF